MINFIIWLLTDINFIKEWHKRSFLNKIEISYTAFGFLFLEIILFCFFTDIFINFIRSLF